MGGKEMVFIVEIDDFLIYLGVGLEVWLFSILNSNRK